MRTLDDLITSLDGLKAACLYGGRWLTDVCQVATEDLRNNENPRGLQHQYWKGACRGDYTTATRQWSFFCPVWHTGQAITALVRLHQLTGDAKWLAAAESGAGFILNNRLTECDDAGLLLAYEDHPDKVNVSAVVEALDGLFELGDACSDPSYTRAALAAAKWCHDRAWIRGQGLIRDLYDPQEKHFIDRPYVSKDDGPGRPLVDDSVWFTAYQHSDDSQYREMFYEILDHLIENERPAGNWVDYGPCHPEQGWCHPRHAYWWGRPMLTAWRDTGEQRWLDTAIRAGRWYLKAQRIDGGMFRDTDLHFNTPSFGHATSGTLCAGLLWLDLFDATQDPCWLEPIQRAVRFAMTMQFTAPEDPQLSGSIIEQVLPPDGTDRSLYVVRDVGTIFFVQMATALLLRFQSDAGRSSVLPKTHVSPLLPQSVSRS